ncbi:MAG: M67 family metallopeptidase [Euryarchaeota archaeon]|nr:M67 family metallopeptidase [Euryarchaeota archaeon]MBU4221691.1 M67 family metallopeptidase [Euryarchaeota archaeon]MBU4340864.1 M67 family metallopeptidase [Euryarchaeota archaeon]MBU4454195.1 M67 family metallopeptidase [Euryarchaeota archaeon]MCG2736718.1 M67 family metallopeptidase [Candidatus Methanoperedenaceae archaeon]
MIEEIKIFNKDLNKIRSELEANKPYEACGVLIGTLDGSTALVEKALPITNSKRTVRSFELDPKEHYDAWNEAWKSSKDIVGVYHTHPVSSANPSPWDVETMSNDTSVWLIAGADGMRAYVWDNGIKPVKLTEY